MSRTFIELSHPIESGAPVFHEMTGRWGLARSMVFTWEGYEDTAYLRTRGKVDKLLRNCMIVMSDHGFTHVDAISHINPFGKTIEEVPPDQLFGSAVVLDITHLKPTIYDPFKHFGPEHNGVVSTDYITTEEVQKALARAGEEIRRGDIVLLRTDFSKLWPKIEYCYHYVPFAIECLNWLIDRGVKAIGLDQVTIDIAPEQGDAHDLLRKRDFYHIENLTNLDLLPATRVRFAAFPMKWEKGSGSPLRALAVIDGET